MFRTPPQTYSHVDKRGYLKLVGTHWYARCRGSWVSIPKHCVCFRTLLTRSKYERKLKLGEVQFIDPTEVVVLDAKVT